MIFDRHHNAIVYEGAEAVAAARACLSKARRLPGNRIVLPADLDVLQRLRSQGVAIPAPLESYSWPGRFTPFHAQNITSNWLVTTPRGFVFSDMGTGKTAAALWAADWLMSQSETPFACLVVAPLSTLSIVWKEAVFKTFLGKRKAVVLHGSAEQRVKRLAEPADFYIINPDGLGVGVSSTRKGEKWSGLAAALEARQDIQLVIVDEASTYRDSTTRRHKIAMRMFAPKPYLWLMTGTPTANGPLDAYGMAKLVNDAHGESFRSYQDRTMVKLSMFKWIPRNGSKEKAHQLLQPAIRFAISDCMDLPPCTVQGREVALSEEQTAAYKTLKKDCQLAIGSGKVISAINEAALRLKLLQISCGAVYDSRHDTHELDVAPRIAALEEILEQTHGKVIVFAPFTNALALIKRKLHGYKTEVINGAVSQTERTRIFAAFQDTPEPRVLIADPGTMAHGLTLTAASVIVWWCPSDKTETYLQANKRIDRPGQKVATTIVQLSATAVEREIYRRLESNESLQGALMKMMEHNHDPKGR